MEGFSSLVTSFLNLQLVFLSVLFFGVLLQLFLKNIYPKSVTAYSEIVGVIIIVGISELITYHFVPNFLFLILAVMNIIFLIFPFFFIFKDYTISGKFFFVVNYQLLIIGTIWGAWYIETLPISILTKVLMFSSMPFILLTLPLLLVQILEQFEILTHEVWKRPHLPLSSEKRSSYPKVSIQVPSHAEPPEIVIETLNHIAAIDYPNFEVIVIDNNTEDESLWKPVEKHCEELGSRFRFMHIMGIKGAKAGALNYAMSSVSNDAEILFVVDADYHVNKQFLNALVGYFDESNIGFVQTPHDYRDWEKSRYLRNCYWEYELFFRTTMVSLNERDVALTVGTMCLIRKEALIKAGGWAEWCLTEDSELAIRIHALGYSSIYLTASYGKGLIPETFEGYKKQRYRWTAGPIQELKHHFKLLNPFGKVKSALTFSQKIEHLNHGLDRASIGLSYLLMPLGLAVLISMIYHHELIPVPFALWIFMTVMLFSGLSLNLFIYMFVFRCSFTDTIGAIIASRSLSHTIAMACIRALFSNKFTWNRTNKFAVIPQKLRMISSVKTEVVLGFSLLSIAYASYLLLPQSSFMIVLVIGLVLKSLDYFAAWYMAYSAEVDLAKKVPTPSQ